MLEYQKDGRVIVSMATHGDVNAALKIRELLEQAEQAAKTIKNDSYRLAEKIDGCIRICDTMEEANEDDD
jgi:hypothetical protein